MRACHLLIYASAVALAGCVSVPKEAALKLAKAGQDTTAASQRTLQLSATEVGGVTERNLVRFALDRCQAQAGGPPPPPCAPQPYTAEVARAEAANLRLATVIGLRVKAISQLNAAYAAFQAEAAYDARTDLDGALGELSETVTALSAATAALTGGAGIPLLAAAPFVRRAAGIAADDAQRRRLLAASAALREIDGRLIDVLRLEQGTYANIADTLLSNRTTVLDRLVAGGLVDPAPTVADFLQRNDLGAPAELEASDPRVVVAARTILNYRARRTPALVAAGYEARR